MANAGATDKSCTLHLHPMPVAWDFSKVKEFVKNQCESQEVKNASMYVYKPAEDGGQDSESVYIRLPSPNLCRLAHTELQNIELNGKKVKVEICAPGGKPNYFKPQTTKENYINKKNFSNYSSGPPMDEGPPSLETFGLSVGFLTSLDIQPPLRNKVFVSNIEWTLEEPEVRELMSLAGQVVSIRMMYSPKGEPLGRGTVEYDHPVEAVQAISMLHGQEFFGRKLVVVMDKYNNVQTPLPRGLTAVGMGLGPNGRPLKAVRTAVEIQPLKKQLDKTIFEIQRLSGESVTTDNFTPYGMGVIDNPNMNNFGSNMPFMGPMQGPFMPQMNGPFMGGPGPNMPMSGPGPNMPMPGPGPNMPMPGPGPNMPMSGPNMPMPGPNMPMPGPNMPMPGPNMPMLGPNMPMHGPNMPIAGPNMPMPGPNMHMPPPNMPMPRPNLPMPGPNMPRPNMRMRGPNIPTPRPNTPQPTTPVVNSMPSPPGTSPAAQSLSPPQSVHSTPPKPLPIKIKQVAKSDKFTQPKPEETVEKPTQSKSLTSKLGSPSASNLKKPSTSKREKPEAIKQEKRHERPARHEKSSTSRHERSSSKNERRTSKYEKDASPEVEPEGNSEANKNDELLSRFQELLKGRSKPTLDVLEGFMDQVMSLTKTVSALRDYVPKENEKKPAKKTRVSKWDQTTRASDVVDSLSDYHKDLLVELKTKNSAMSQQVGQDYAESERNDHKRRYNEEELASMHGAPAKQRRVNEPAVLSSDMLMFTNLPPTLTLPALSNKMREVGALRFAELTGQGRAIVRFHRLTDAQQCIKLFHRSKVDGQIIEVQPF